MSVVTRVLSAIDVESHRRLPPVKRPSRNAETLDIAIDDCRMPERPIFPGLPPRQSRMVAGHQQRVTDQQMIHATRKRNRTIWSFVIAQTTGGAS